MSSQGESRGRVTAVWKMEFDGVEKGVKVDMLLFFFPLLLFAFGGEWATNRTASAQGKGVRNHTCSK